MMRHLSFTGNVDVEVKGVFHMISAYINSVLSAEKPLNVFEKRVDQLMQGGLAGKNPVDKEAVTQLAVNYVRSVADLLADCEVQSSAMGLQRFIFPVIQTASAYLLKPDDYIPDSKGLYGLLDDAYLACRFVARMSELVQMNNGFPLLDTSLDKHSPVIRALIGEPLATQLDMDIEATINTLLAQIQIEQIQTIQLSSQYYDRNQWVHEQNVINTEAEIMSIASGAY